MNSQHIGLESPWVSSPEGVLFIPGAPTTHDSIIGSQTPFSPAHAAIKRTFDVVVAVTALIALTPLLIILALAVRFDSRGPIFFRQIRLGRGGVPFRITKFRTMIPDAEARLREIEHLNESEGGVLFKLKTDPRVTRLGRFLRRTSLDELPQLFDVLAGHMSLVGPRPLPLRDSEILRRYDLKGFRSRLSVPPGVTGPWQVGGRSEVGVEGMLRYDLEYIARPSLKSDLWILLKTIRVLVLRQGAH